MAAQGIVYRFAHFELDIDRAELRRRGEPVRLAPQPFKVLHLLLSRANGLVTREELKAELWGTESFVDFDAGLNFCMAQLRAVLDDRAAEPTLIATLPRRGYKFIAPVDVTSPAAPTSPEPLKTPGALPHDRWARTAALAAASTLIVSVAATQGSDDMSRVPQPGSRVPAASELFDRGALGMADAGPAELVERIARFEQAIRLDAGFAGAYAALAEAKLILGSYRTGSAQADYAAAKTAAARALELSPRLAYAHAAYGAALLYFEWDWSGAARHLDRAVALDNGSTRAHQWLSKLLSARGQHEAAIAHARIAVRLAPTSVSGRTSLGFALFYAGRYSESGAVCEEALQLLPQFLPARACANLAAAESGARPDAQAYWRERLDRLSTDLSASGCECQAHLLAVPLAHLGETDRALTLLERAADLRSDGLLFAGVHPAFAVLHDQPRFTALMRRVGLPRPSTQ